MTSNVVYLLDSNVLIALLDSSHSFHGRAVEWARNRPHFATCPITQGALIRHHLRLSDHSSIQSAKSLIASVTSMRFHQFWPDDASYLDIPEKGVTGHRQVTDAYLVALAQKHKGVLATMDEALAAIHSGVFLIPRYS
jgi:uncharacterized protein